MSNAGLAIVVARWTASLPGTPPDTRAGAAGACVRGGADLAKLVATITLACSAPVPVHRLYSPNATTSTSKVPATAIATTIAVLSVRVAPPSLLPLLAGAARVVFALRGVLLVLG